jgi:hypothetical protein
VKESYTAESKEDDLDSMGYTIKEWASLCFCAKQSKLVNVSFKNLEHPRYINKFLVTPGKDGPQNCTLNGIPKFLKI